MEEGDVILTTWTVDNKVIEWPAEVEVKRGSQIQLRYIAIPSLNYESTIATHTLLKAGKLYDPETKQIVPWRSIVRDDKQQLYCVLCKDWVSKDSFSRVQKWISPTKRFCLAHSTA